MRQISGDVIAQSDCRHGYEAEVECVEEAPVSLYDHEDGRRNEKDDDDDEAEDDEDVSQLNVEDAECLAEPAEQSVVHNRCVNHEPLDKRLEDDQRQLDSEHHVQKTEDLAMVRQRRYVPVACTYGPSLRA